MARSIGSEQEVALGHRQDVGRLADEEFAIEKSKLVRESTADIDAEYEKKFKQASMSQQITRSTQANKTRLRVLSSRQELLDELFEKARGKLGDAGKGKDYDATLKDLVLECMYLMGEKKVGVRCRKGDKAKVESASKKAAEEYKKNMGSEVEPVIDEKNWLPESSYVIPGPCLPLAFANYVTAPEVSSFSAVTAKSSSTTHSKSGSVCWKQRRYRACERLCSARTRTADSTTRTTWLGENCSTRNGTRRTPGGINRIDWTRCRRIEYSDRPGLARSHLACSKAAASASKLRSWRADMGSD